MVMVISPVLIQFNDDGLNREGFSFFPEMMSLMLAFPGKAREGMGLFCQWKPPWLKPFGLNDDGK
jgi:hypothetical protein